MNIGEALQLEQPGLLYQPSKDIILNDTGIGVEIELENIKYSHSSDKAEIPKISKFYTDDGIRESLPSLQSLWKITKDGSLRNGEEFIFNGPLFGANIFKALDVFQSFVDVYRLAKNPVSTSHRTSVHVHMDVRDLDEAAIKNLTLIYILVERVIFAYVNPERIKNNYCRAITDSLFKYTFQSIYKTNSTAALLEAIRSGDKYSAFNILPIFKYGSIEFRHHQGTSNILSLKDWINIILCIKRATAKDISVYIEEYKTNGYRKVLEDIFEGTGLLTKISQDHEIPYLMLRGYNDVVEILNMEKLSDLTFNHVRPKVRPADTLLYKFKVANNLLPNRK